MREEFNLAMRSLLFIAIAVAAWLMGIIVGQENAVIILNPNTSTANIREASNPNVSIMFDYNNGDIDILKNVELKGQANLWEAMLGAQERGDIDLGYNDNWSEVGLQWFGINNYFNSTEAHWYIWLNNKYLSGLPDNIEVKNGDVLYFKYLSYYPR